MESEQTGKGDDAGAGAGHVSTKELAGAEDARRVLLPMISAMSALAANPSAAAKFAEGIHTQNNELVRAALREVRTDLDIEVGPGQDEGQVTGRAIARTTSVSIHISWHHGLDIDIKVTKKK